MPELNNNGAATLGSVSVASRSMIRLFGLDIYSDSLISRPVEKYLSRNAWAITFVSGVNFWAWSRAWSYAVGPWTGTLLGFVCAFLLACLDISIATADTSVVMDNTQGRWKKTFAQLKVSWGRVLAIVLASFVTSVPIAMGVFSKEIATKLAATADTVAETDTKRTKLRQEIVVRYDAELASLEQKVSEAENEMVCEEGIGQCKLGGKKLKEQGPRYHAWLSRKTQLTAEEWVDQKTKMKYRGRIPALKTAHQRALEEFDRKTVALKEQTREMVKTNDEQWGFKDRYGAFSQLRAMDRLTNQVAWGCQLAFMIIELLVLFLKLNAPTEAEKYFSAIGQARARQSRDDEAHRPKEKEERAEAEKVKAEADAAREKQEAIRRYVDALHAYKDAKLHCLYLAHRALLDASNAIHARVTTHGLWMEHVEPVAQKLRRTEAELIMLKITAPKLDLGNQELRSDGTPWWDTSEAQMVEMVYGQGNKLEQMIFLPKVDSSVKQTAEIVAQTMAVLKPPSNGAGKPNGHGDPKETHLVSPSASVIIPATLDQIKRFVGPRRFRPRSV